MFYEKKKKKKYHGRRPFSILLHGDSTWEPTMAASSGIQLPERFNFSRTEDWPTWIHSFERYGQAFQLNKKDDTLQITLIYAMGHQAEDILT